jgi:uncharacterized protein with PIN domain
MKGKYTSAKKTIFKLLSTIKLHYDENELKEILAELREIKDCYDVQCMIDEVLEELSSELNICPECGSKLVPSIHIERHTEIDGDFKEEFLYYECEECGFSEQD